MFKISELLKCLLVGVLLICVLAICLLPFMGACTKEVDRYETKVEIVHVDFAYAKYSPRYSMAIANDEINDTIPISAKEYAKYKEGDTLTIEVVTYANKFGDTLNKYEIIEKNP